MTKRATQARTGGGRRDPAFDAAVGARIRDRRKLKKLSQDELAEQIGTSGGQVSRYEAGETTVEPAMLALIAECLGCKPGVFLDGLKVDGS